MKRIVALSLLLLIVAVATARAQSIGEIPVFSVTNQYKIGDVVCPPNTVLVFQVIEPRRALVSCPPYLLAAPTITPVPSPLPTVTPFPTVPVEFVWSSQPDSATGIDTNIVENLPGSVQANSTKITINARAGLRNVGLLYFDVSDIPANSVVTSATLTLHNAVTSTQTISFALHSLLPAAAYFSELSNWNYLQPSAVRWNGDAGPTGGIDAGASVAGVDYNSAPLGYSTYVANTPSNTVYALGLVTSQVQTWLDGNNYGILLRSSNGGNFSFHSSEAVDPAVRPRLDITYMVID